MKDIWNLCLVLEQFSIPALSCYLNLHFNLKRVQGRYHQHFILQVVIPATGFDSPSFRFWYSYRVWFTILQVLLQLQGLIHHSLGFDTATGFDSPYYRFWYLPQGLIHHTLGFDAATRLDSPYHRIWFTILQVLIPAKYRVWFTIL